jgi:hypothetical protein
MSRRGKPFAADHALAQKYDRGSDHSRGKYLPIIHSQDSEQNLIMSLTDTLREQKS